MTDRLFPDIAGVRDRTEPFGPEYYGCELLCEMADTALYSGRSIARGKPVLIKTAIGREASQKLFREYSLLKKISLPGLARLLGLEVVSGTTILVFEDDGSRPLSLLSPGLFRDPSVFFPPALELCRIMERLHRLSITHQFLCSSCIFVNPRSLSVNLAGFCHAFYHLRQPPGPWDGRLMEGAMEYAAPEQMGVWGRPVDGRCDIYGLGAVFFEMLAGHALPPLPADEPARLDAAIRALRDGNPAVGEPLAAIIRKCLAPEPSGRYQSVHGLYEDLHECFTEQQRERAGAAFRPGGKDQAVRLWAPGPVRGRIPEKKALMEALERAVRGETVAVFVTGRAGIGKTALLNEMRQQVGSAGGGFLAGGFSVLSRSRPFGGLGSAISNLSWDILRKTPQAVAQTRKRLSRELAGHAGLLLTLAPEASFFLEAPPPPLDLSPREAASRRSLTFYRFFSALGKDQEVLALFLDDAQFADASSMAWISDLICGRRLTNFLLLCAFRDGPGEDCREAEKLLQELREKGADLTHLPLAPLSRAELSELVRDVAPGYAGPENSLTELVFEKSGGNPLAAHRFLRFLSEKELLYFDPRQGGLVLDEEKAKALGGEEKPTQAAADLARLPAETLRFISAAAAVGPRFTAAALEKALGAERKEVYAALSRAAAADLIRPEGTESKLIYDFTHDSIREAAYALMAPDAARDVHRALALFFMEKEDTEPSDEAVFAAAYHLRRAAPLPREPRWAVIAARVFLSAGLLARERAAFPEALEHLSQGISLLPDNAWEQEHQLTLDLYVSAVEAEILAGSDTKAEELLRRALGRARSQEEAIRLIQARFTALISQNRVEEALDAGILALSLCGISLSRRISMMRAVAQFALSARSVCRLSDKELAALPESPDPDQDAILNLLFTVCFSSYSVSVPLFLSTLATAGKITVKKGISPAGASILAGFSLVLASDGRFPDAMKLSEAVALLSLRYPGQPSLARAQAVRACFLLPWESSLREASRQSSQAATRCLAVGLFEEAAMSSFWSCAHLFLAGEELNRVDRAMNRTVAELSQAGEKVFSRLLSLWKQAVNNLAGLPEDPCDLSGFSAPGSGDDPLQAPDNMARLDHSFLSIMLCTLFGRYDQAVPFFVSASGLCDNEAGTQIAPVFHFYGALALLAREEKPCSDAWKMIRKSADRLDKWASQNPSNHLCRYLMVQAEICRARGDMDQAKEHLVLAEKHARKNQMAGEAALARELMGKLLLLTSRQDEGLAAIAAARQSYLVWGAMAKAKDLDTRFGALFLRSPRLSDLA